MYFHQQVNPSSPAQGSLSAGDNILSIGNFDTASMTHAQASQLIQDSGDSLRLTLTRYEIIADTIFSDRLGRYRLSIKVLGCGCN